jgi:hypothetical protein
MSRSGFAVQAAGAGPRHELLKQFAETEVIDRRAHPARQASPVMQLTCQRRSPVNALRLRSACRSTMPTMPMSGVATSMDRYLNSS